MYAGLQGESGLHRVFAVSFKEANNRATKLLVDAYSSYYRLQDNLFLVRTRDLADTVAKTVGIKGEDRFVSGVVFRLKPIYAGFYNGDLWDWLEEDGPR